MESRCDAFSLDHSLMVALLSLNLLVPVSASASFVGHEILYEFLLPYPSTPLESAAFLVGSGPDLVGGTAAGATRLRRVDDLDRAVPGRLQ